jgi:hypothetical protein
MDIIYAIVLAVPAILALAATGYANRPNYQR